MLRDRDLVSIQDARAKVEKAYAAFQHFRRFTQEQVDAVIDRVAAVARANAERLAQLAVEETGYGNVRDKTAKNLLNSDLLHRAIRPLQTVGILREDPEQKIIEIAEPVGVVAAVLPTTNPTSTAIYKILIALKGRNTIVLSPHPRAVKCTCETAALLYRAAREAGAPEDVIQCLDHPTLEATNEIMRHRRTGVILSTGGQGIVRAAYSSGKPALGVGPGNVPVLLDRTADVKEAVRMVVEGKAFDYGTVCSSEQALVFEAPLREQVIRELKANRAHLCDAVQQAALAKLLITPDFRVNPACVGQPPAKIAQMAGFSVPPETSILVVEIAGVGKEHPLSAEKLSPVLSLYAAKDFDDACRACDAILHFGGLGHTCVIYSRDQARIREFGLRMPAMRVLVNTPAPQGSTGITTNVFPSMTLGCGAMAGNVTGDNIGPLHLINIKRIAWHVRDAASAFTSAEGRAYFAAGAAAPPARAAGPVGAPAEARPGIAEAARQYLASRGIDLAGTPAVPPAAPAASALPSPAAEVVDRFLASRRSNPPPTGGAGPPTSEPRPPAASPPPPAPPVEVVPFVSESDVRRAMLERKKIYISSRTIVTPAARDLGSDILVKTD
jgi:acetaldehyde dehydrogenase (acetylating)